MQKYMMACSSNHTAQPQRSYMFFMCKSNDGQSLFLGSALNDMKECEGLSWRT